jgi:hypothetical protein
MSDITIKNVLPKAALPGGEVVIEYAGRELAGTVRPEVRFGDFAAQVTLASNDHIIAKVPESSAEVGTHEIVVSTNGDTSRPFPYEVGKKLVEFHPVANPALDGEGNIYATYSGRRGQKTPVSIYKISPKGAVTPFVTDIMNATGLAFSLTGELFVSSRYEGNVYRVDRSGHTEMHIEGMGIATGIALDHNNNLYVGDRSGSIFKISPKKKFLCSPLWSQALPHTISRLIRRLSVCDRPDDVQLRFDLSHIAESGQVDRFFTGLGRPQGVAFDIDGTLRSGVISRAARNLSVSRSEEAGIGCCRAQSGRAGFRPSSQPDGRRFRIAVSCSPRDHGNAAAVIAREFSTFPVD